MIVHVLPDLTLRLEEEEDFRSFKLMISTGRRRLDEVRAALAGFATLDGEEHAWVSEAALRRSGSRAGDAGWQDRLGAMIETVRPFGWVDAERQAIRAHVEWREEAAAGAGQDEPRRLFILGIGGTTAAGSATERALAVALRAAEAAGAATEMIGGVQLARLPIYAPEDQERTAEQRALVASVRRADGLILATPAYHAGISGLVKNAVDLLEDLRNDRRPYLDGRAVGCLVTAFGWQGGGTTLISVRTIVHALRGWPTPLGVTLNTAEPMFDPAGACTDEKAAAQLAMLAQQVIAFARNQAAR